MDKPLIRLAEANGLRTTDTHEWPANVDADIGEFVAASDPRAIFVVEQKHGLIIGPPPRSGAIDERTLVIVKPSGPLPPDSWDRHVISLALPLNGGNTFNYLHALISRALLPIFDSQSTNAGTQARHKLVEAERALAQLLQHTQVEFVDLTAGSTATQAREALDDMKSASQDAPEETSSAALNKLQSVVNVWKQHIVQLTSSDRDVSKGSSSDEIGFWLALETALQSVQEQLTSPLVAEVWETLERNKRFHATHNFSGDTGLSEALSKVQGYTQLLFKDMPLGELLAASNIEQLVTSTDAVFGHINKKIRASGYPTQRSVAFVEALGRDFNSALTRIAEAELESVLDTEFDDFSEFYDMQSVIGRVRLLIRQAEDAAEVWDSHIRDFATVARDLMRRRSERFFVIRIQSAHSALITRAKALDAMCAKHSELRPLLTGSSVDTSSLDKAFEDVIACKNLLQLDQSHWHSLEVQYSREIHSAEKHIAQELLSELTNAAEDEAQLFSVLARHQSVLARPEVRLVVHRFQRTLIDSAVRDVKAVKRRSQSLPAIETNIVDRIVHIRQLCLKTLDIKNRLAVILGPEWRQHTDGSQIGSDCDALEASLTPDKDVQEWCNVFLKNNKSEDDEIEKRRVFATDERSGKLIVQGRVEHTQSSLRSLKALGFRFDPSLTSAVESATDHDAALARLSDCLASFESLIRTLELYPRISLSMDVVHMSHQIMAFVRLGLSEITWESADLAEFVAGLEKAISMLDVRVSRLVETDSAVSDELSTNSTDVQLIKQRVFGILDSSASSEYVEAVTSDLNTVISQKISKKLTQWRPTMQLHRIEIVNQTVRITPDLSSSISAWLAELNALVEPAIEVTSQICDAYLDASDQMWQSWDAARLHCETWLSLQLLWDLDVGETLHEFGSNASVLLGALDELLNMRRLLGPFKNELVTLDVSDIRAIVESKCDMWQQAIAHRLADVLLAQSTELISGAKQVRQNLESSGPNFQGLLSLTTGLTKALEITKRLKDGIEPLHASQAVLGKSRFSFPAGWISADQMKSELQALDTVTQMRAAELKRAKPRILQELESRAATLVGNADDFRSLWLAHKPLQPHIEPAVALKTLTNMMGRAVDLKNSATEICGAYVSLDTDAEPPLKLKALTREAGDWVEEVEKFTLGWTDIRSGWLAIKRIGSQLLFKADILALSRETKDLATSIGDYPDRTRRLQAFDKLSDHVRLCVQSFEKLLLLRQSDAIQPRHVMKLVPSLDSVSEDTLQLQELWLRLPETSIVSEVIETAEGEHQLTRYLESASHKWLETTLCGRNNVIYNLSTVLQLCDDHLSAFNGMRASPYFAAVAASVLDWERRLGTAHQCFDQFVDMQKQYVYLRGIFTSDAVALVLPSESRRFKGLADEFEHIYSKSEGRPALEVAGIPRLPSFISRLINQFASLYRSLSGFLETQRRRFPRLYFVGDDDLLEIVGTNVSEWGAKYLNLIFPGVSKLEDDAIVSPEGERLILSYPVAESTSDNVELLIKLEKRISDALRQKVMEAINHLAEAWPDPIKFKGWLTSLPVQAVVVALREQWTRHIAQPSETRLDRRGEYETILQWLSSTGDSSLLWVRRRESVIAELTYALDNLHPRFAEMLVTVKKEELKPTKTTGIDVTYQVSVSCGNTQWDYGYEYIGAPEPIVRTKTTDELYFTAATAIAQGKGGSVVGPAGTGKTETIRSLGALFGHRVVVFNCDDQFDFLSVSRAMEGCSATKSWACFDEFNRLSRNVLSSVAQVVSDGVRNAPVFVTMNPGYAGRTVLPPNMRSQFREFVLDNPDSREIAKVLLSAHGKVPPDTSDATVRLLDGMKAKASPQEHYDWGLRALKGALRVCQILNGDMRDACEIAIRPRLIPEDKDLFDREIENTFPHTRDVPSAAGAGNIGLTNLAEGAVIEAAEQLHPYVNTLNIFCHLFTGVMLLGPTGCGKSYVRKALIKACHGEEVVVDPSATTKATLLGRLDPITREWTDGLISRLLRKILNNLRDEQSKQWFLVFDGEVEPDWAEALNSVLDSTRQLTLASGEILPVPPQLHIIFETSNLKTATPATVSRCGIICLPEFVDKNLCDNSVLLKAFEAAKTINHCMHYSESRVLATFNSLKTENKWLSLVWALAGDSDATGRENISELIRSLAPSDAQLPQQGSLTDYYVSELTGRWHSWYDSIGNTSGLTSDAVNKPEVVIPTADTAAHEALLQIALTSRRPLLLVGPPGSGKTMTLFSALRQMPQVDLISLNFSSNATPELVVQALEMHCEYTKGSDGSLTLAPSGSHWAALFIDEINLPRPKYKDSDIVPVIQFLRHFVEYNGFYNDNGTFVKVERVQLVAACNPPPQRRPLSNSFLRHLTVVHVDYPSLKSLATIYGSLMATFSAESLVDPMLQLYEDLPRVLPSEIWTPRELTRWMRSIYADWNATAEGSRTSELLHQLWLYEGSRVLGDRLRGEDQKAVHSLLLKYYPDARRERPNGSLFSDAVWSPFMSQRPKFIPLADLREFLSARLSVFIEEAAGEGDKYLVAHDDFVQHVSRTDRILRQTQGHALLVGPPSVGKTTTVRFACWLAGVDLRIVRSHSGYSDAEFAQDLRKILLSSIRRSTCMLMGDDLLQVPEFVERMNSLLANGEVPGLFSTPDQLAELEESCRRSGFDGSDLFVWFRTRTVMNLHVVFKTTSTVGLSTALLNRCVVNNIEAWSMPVKRQVAEVWCAGTDAGPGAVEALASLEPLPSQPVVSNGCVTFIESCYQFVRIYNSSKTKLEESQLHFVSGSDRLKSTVLEVGSLKRRLAGQKEQLSVEEQRGNEVLTQILEDQSEAERKRAAAVEIRAAVRAQSHQIEKRQQAARDDLAATQPLIEQAAQGVRNIKKTHLNELRSMMNPPEPVKITLEAVCLVLGLRTDGSWRQVLAAVRGDEFIPRIVNFDTERLTPEVLSKIENEYMSIPSFTYERVDRASKAGGPLLRWVVAQISYGRALAAIQPLMREINHLNEQASESRAQLKAIESMLADLEEAMESSKREYSRTMAQCEALKAEMQSISTNLVRAESLLSSLDGEKDRWRKASEQFPHEMGLLVGKSLVEAAMISLSGKQSRTERQALASHVKRLAEDNSIRLEDSVIPDFEDVNFVNRQIIGHSRSVALVVDPANRWDATKEEMTMESTLKVSSFLLDPDSLAKELDVALRFGQHLVIKHAERFDPLILPLLTRDFVRKGSRLLVNFGNGDIDISPGFRLTLHSRSIQQTPPLLLSRVNIADYTISGAAFEQMTRDLLIAVQKPDLASRRDELRRVDAETTEKLRDLEHRLLTALAESSATEKLLENQALLHSLEKLKSETSQLNAVKLSTEQTLSDLNDAVEEFAPQAKQAARVYELSSSLSQVDRFYAISVDWLWTMAQQSAETADFINDFTSRVLSRLLRVTKSEHWDLVANLFPAAAALPANPISLVGVIAECPNGIATIAGMATQNTPDPAGTIAQQSAVPVAMIAMGSPLSEAKADGMLLQAMELGEWLVIQNIEIAREEWLRQLSRRMQTSAPSPNFRLILTGLQAELVDIPDLIAAGRPISIERQQGIRSGLLNTLSARSSFLDFIICYVHACFTERFQAASYSETDLAAARWLSGRMQASSEQHPSQLLTQALLTAVWTAKTGNTEDRALMKQFVDRSFNSRSPSPSDDLYKWVEQLPADNQWLPRELAS